MIELGKNAPLLQESLQQGLRIHAALEQLHRGGLHHVALVTLRQPHLAHAAAAEQVLHTPAGTKLGIGLGSNRCQHFLALFEYALGARIGDQHRSHLGGKFGVASCQLGQCQLLGRCRQVDQLIKPARHLRPALRARVSAHRG